MPSEVGSLQHHHLPLATTAQFTLKQRAMVDINKMKAMVGMESNKVTKNVRHSAVV